MSDSRNLLIRGGDVVLGRTVSQQDVLIRGETIAAVGDLSGIQVDEEIDAGGLIVMPGGIDTHVHLNDVFMSTVSVHDYDTGTVAAAFGGTTTLIDFSNQIHGESLKKTLSDKNEESAGKAVVDFGVHPVITDPTPQTLDEIPWVVQEGAPTVKCYMTYREDGLLIEMPDLKKIHERLRDAGGMLMVHAEDNDLMEQNVARLVEEGKTQAFYHAVSKPPEVEDVSIRGCIDMVRELGGTLFVVHLASDVGMELIGRARAEGVDILAETCTHYLVFPDEILKRDDGIKWICSPPLRSPAVQKRLWAGIKDGRIRQVTSDDAAYSWEAKQYGLGGFDKCPNGIPGIEARVPILYSEGVAKGRISLARFVELVATNPARLFGLAPNKGSLNPGADADVVLLDPKARWTMGRETLHMKTDWAAYEGIEVTGKIEKVFSRGELIISGNECLAKKGRGRYVHRKLSESLRHAT